MKILIHFSFSPEQIQIFQQIADAHSQHKVVQAHSESEAIAMAEDAEVLLGLFHQLFVRPHLICVGFSLTVPV